jgi:hypothetical protein
MRGRTLLSLHIAMEVTMIRRLMIVLALLLVAARAQALEYTDVYYNAAESGWGVFVVQSNTFQFLAIFIYDANNKPTWYTANITDDGTGKYTGPLYATTGTYFASPWQGVQATQVGTATFSPVDLYHATLTYTVNNVATVTKSVVRQTLTPYQMTGVYSGSMSGSISNCNNPGNNDPAFRGRYTLTATQSGDAALNMTFGFVDTVHNGITCVVAGGLTHLGRLYQMSVANTTLTCTGPGQNGNPAAVQVESLHPTGQGIEGRFSGTAANGCVYSLHFAAVLDVNN